MSLHGTRLKLDRAEYHLSALEQAFDAFSHLKPYALTVEPDPNPPDYALRVNILHSPPDNWSSIIGDFAHNARSALDLLVYQLSALPPNDKKTRFLQFPSVCLPGSTKGATGYSDKVDMYLAGGPTPYRTIIERYQPYNGPQGPSGDALSLLRDLNNTDKP